MKKYLFYLFLSTLLCGCNIQKTPANPLSFDESNENISNEIPSDEEDIKEDLGPIITLSEKELDVFLDSSKSIYLTINVPSDYQYDADLGQWTSSNEEIVSISNYGKIIPHKVGTAYIRYIDSNNVKSSRCVVNVYESTKEITKKWKKVTDFDSIDDGDQILFANEELNIAVTNNRYNGYLLPTQCHFSNDGNYVESISDEVATFYVTGENGIYTLENQNGLYLAGKSTNHGNGLLFVKEKGQTHWIFEKPSGYIDGYCVNYDIDNDLWLMFNKINNSDIRFNLYDSNPGELMKLPDIYRLEVIK